MSTATTLGPYEQYEVPSNLSHIFYEDDGETPVDLTGCAVEVHWWIKGQTPADTVQTFVGTLVDGPSGSVSVPWVNAPEVFEEVGLHEVQIYAGDSSYRWASSIFRFMVRQGVATTEPTV